MGSAFFSCHSSLSRWQEYEAIYVKVRAHYPLSQTMQLKRAAFEHSLRSFLPVDVTVAVELLLLPLHTSFDFPILTVGGSGASLSTDSYKSSALN